VKTRTWSLTLVILVSVLSAWSQTPFVSSCAEDAKIDAAKRQAVETGATRFLQALFSPDPSAAFDALSTEGRQDTNREQVADPSGPPDESKLI
jgi:hypothetical protein